VRYYSIIITDPDTGQEFQKYTSFVNGQTMAGALDIELDVPVVTFASPMGIAFVRIWGIPLQQVSQSNDLKNKQIQVYAGMQRGLPLANINANYAGLIVQGFIQQAIGNWVGNEMTLDLFIAQNTGSVLKPANLVLDWKKNTDLASAIKTTLSTAFPSLKLDIDISDDLKLAEDQKGYYSTLVELAQYIKQESQNILGGTYAGVDIVIKQSTIVVRDGSTPASNPKQINFEDMVGQPTWIDAPFINIKLVMRGDLFTLDYLRLPEKGVLPITTPQSLSQLRDLSVFKGTLRISQIRHVGHFRQPTAEAWVTVVDAYPVQ